MKNKISRNYEEELSFGKFKDIEDSKLNEYIIFHLRRSPLKGIEKENSEERLNYSALKGYLKGASFGKLDLELIMYNGIHKKIKRDLGLNMKIYPLNRLELEKLIEDSGMPKHIVIKNIK